MDESKLRLTARVAPFICAIQEKRAAGWKWSDIREALGFTCTDHALSQAVKACKWTAAQQPLPETKPSPAQRGQVEASAQPAPVGRYSSAVKAPGAEDIDALFDRNSTK